jgi:asparagine synthase (glutamine-hydrolysing)
MYKLAKKILLSAIGFLRSRYYLLSIDVKHQALIKDIRSKNLTYLSIRKLTNIAKICNNIKKDKLSGIFIEAGCALGGSTILISKLKNPITPFYAYDIFETIPPPTIEDTKDVHERYKTIIEGESFGIGGDKYYGYEENLYDIVKYNLKEFQIDTEENNVNLVQGLIQDTLEINAPVAFAHIDVD